LQADRFSRESKLRIFAGYYRPHWRLFALDLSCALGISLVDLAFPLVTRYSIQELLPRRAYSLFGLAMALAALAFAARAALQYVVTYWGHLLGVRMETDMRRDLFTHLQKLSFSFYDNARTGHLMSRILSDLFEIVELAHHGPEDVFIAMVTITGSLVAMALIRWQLAAVLFILLPSVVWIVVRQRKVLSKTSLAVKQRTAVINAGVESSISGIRVAKAFVNEDYEIEKFGRSNDLYREAKKLFYKAMGVFQCSMEFATSILNVAVIGVGGIFIARGMMDLGDLVAFTLFVNAFLQPVRKLVAFFEQYSTGMAGFERFVELMRIEPEIVDRPGARVLGRARGEVELRGVVFAYREGSPVLRGVDLRVEPGRSLALVGPSGGGKSTICQLLPRFYEVGSGAVLVDGVDVRDLRLDSLRENVGIVQQDVFLFADTIRENIRYGRPDASDEELAEAAERADIRQFIESLPEGYDTQVGERGILLSGGQKQRLSIARVFLKDPPILVLDEATSALDTLTELRIQASLEELSRGRTTLVIAHRLSTIRGADEIAFVEGGLIAERGGHAELMKLHGRYAALYGAQFSLDAAGAAEGRN
jgi:ATP-binding cassette subfamily B protein